MGYTFGEMVLRVMGEEGIRRDELYRGLCSMGTFTRYMSGKFYLDRLLMTAFLQRMGKSPDKFCSILTDGEYAYFEWRHKAELALQRGDWAEMERLLGEEGAQVPCNERLQRQFSLMLQAIIQEKLYGCRTEGLRLLEEALSLTLPGFIERMQGDLNGACRPWENRFVERARLGTQEIHILLLWQALQPDRELAFRLLEGLVRNIDAHYTDKQEKCKIYPKAAAQWLAMLGERGRYYEGLALAKNVLELIGETGCVESLLLILRQYAELAEMVKARDCAEIWEQYEEWKKIMEEVLAEGNGQQGEDAMSYLFCMSQETELFHEMIRDGRQEQGYTQEALSKGICDPATLSRIENGRKPTRKIYRALADRLPLPGEIYYSTIVTGRFDMLELQWEYERQVGKGQLQKAAQLKELLKEGLDCSVISNRQYIEQAELVLKRGMGEIAPQDCLEGLRTILGYSIPRMPEDGRVEQWPEEFWRHAFTDREISLLLMVSDAFYARKEFGKAECLLKKLLEYYGRSRAGLYAHYRNVSLIYGRLASVCSQLGKHRETAKYADRGIRLSIHQGSCGELNKFLGCKAYALAHLGKEAEAAEYYRIAFVSSKVFLGDGDPLAARSYTSLTGRDIH